MKSYFGEEQKTYTKPGKKQNIQISKECGWINFKHLCNRLTKQLLSDIIETR